MLGETIHISPQNEYLDMLQMSEPPETSLCFQETSFLWDFSFTFYFARVLIKDLEYSLISVRQI